MGASSSPHYSTHLHQQDALCVNRCRHRLTINKPRLTPRSKRRNLGCPTLPPSPHLGFLIYSSFLSQHFLLIWGSSKPLIISVSLIFFFCTAQLCGRHTRTPSTLQDKHKLSHGFIQSWGGFACQWQGPVWVFIYLFYESRQGNHISYGCTVTIGLLYRVLSLSSLLPYLSLSVSVFKTSQALILICGGPGRSHEIF